MVVCEQVKARRASRGVHASGQGTAQCMRRLLPASLIDTGQGGAGDAAACAAGARLNGWPGDGNRWGGRMTWTVGEW